MGVLMRKSTFWLKLTQILELKETKTRCGKRFNNGTFIAHLMKVLEPQKNLNSMYTVKSAKYLHLKCYEYECAIIKLFRYLMFSVSCKSRICVNSGQKGDFLKRTPIQYFIIVSWCSPIILQSFKSKIGNVFCPAIF